MDLKLTPLNSEVVKCGFPASSLPKYIKILSTSNYTFEIVDDSKNLVAFSTDEKTNLLLCELNSLDLYSLSVSEAFSYLEKFKKISSEILSSN